MPKHKSLLIAAEVVKAGRRRKCFHNKEHVILLGHHCLEVKVKRAKQGYCLECAKAMLNNAQQEISGLYTILNV